MTQFSPMRAWWFLVVFSFRRMLKIRQLVSIAIGLLILTSLIVVLITTQFGWDRTRVALRRNDPAKLQYVVGGMAGPAIEKSEYLDAIKRENQPLPVFSRWMVFFLYLGFLLPIWTLSFATSALGTERESRSLIWLMTRPMPRWGIYLAKFIAVIPWCLALNLVGFLIICQSAGHIGRQAFLLFWPAVIAGSLAFTAIFHLMGAICPRPAIVGLLYAFFFETILSELPVPGTVKRLSINYYTRCLMYSTAEENGIPTESASLFVPVSDQLAWIVLVGATVAFTVLGMWWFGRTEPREEA